jgi:hypothetical protein
LTSAGCVQRPAHESVHVDADVIRAIHAECSDTRSIVLTTYSSDVHMTSAPGSVVEIGSRRCSCRAVACSQRRSRVYPLVDFTLEPSHGMSLNTPRLRKVAVLYLSPYRRTAKSAYWMGEKSVAAMNMLSILA